MRTVETGRSVHVPALVLGVVLALWAVGFARAQSLPHFDVRPGCRSVGPNAKSEFENCVQTELNTREQLAKQWTSFKAADRANCTAVSTVALQSYVELLVCLETDRNVAASARSRAQQYPPPQPSRPRATRVAMRGGAGRRGWRSQCYATGELGPAACACAAVYFYYPD